MKPSHSPPKAPPGEGAPIPTAISPTESAWETRAAARVALNGCPGPPRRRPQHAPSVERQGRQQIEAEQDHIGPAEPLEHSRRRGQQPANLAGANQGRSERRGHGRPRESAAAPRPRGRKTRPALGDTAEHPEGDPGVGIPSRRASSACPARVAAGRRRTAGPWRCPSGSRCRRTGPRPRRERPRRPVLRR